jgi:mono/diheme cytochrome c family protein
MEQLAESLDAARTIAWQKRAISANKMEHICEESVRVAEFAADVTKPESMRILAMQALRDWTPSSVNRDIVQGRIIQPKHMKFYCIEGIEEALELLFTNANGELLMETLRFAHEHSMIIPEELCVNLVLDESKPIRIRVYALQKGVPKETLDYALRSDHWQLRAAARDVLLQDADSGAEEMLLKTIEQGEVFEAQEAIKSLALYSTAFAKINKTKLRDELQLEYAEVIPLATQINNAWLLTGGNPTLGKKVVFENSRSECLRCHIVNDKGGIAGPSLDGVADRLTQEQLLHALLMPSAEVAEGFGEYSAMPPMDGMLSKRELRDVMAYLKTLVQQDSP